MDLRYVYKYRKNIIKGALRGSYSLYTPDGHEYDVVWSLKEAFGLSVLNSRLHTLYDYMPEHIAEATEHLRSTRSAPPTQGSPDRTCQASPPTPPAPALSADVV